MQGRCESQEGVLRERGLARLKTRPSDRVCLLVSVLLCASAVRRPGDGGCCARQGAAFTLCCQMSSREDVGHGARSTLHSPVFDFEACSVFTPLWCTSRGCYSPVSVAVKCEAVSWAVQSFPKARDHSIPRISGTCTWISEYLTGMHPFPLNDSFLLSTALATLVCTKTNKSCYPGVIW